MPTGIAEDWKLKMNGDKTAAMILILLAFFALWAYNTGRASAILAIVKGQSTQQPAVTTGSSSGGTSTGNCTGNPLDPACIGSIFKGIPDVLKGIGSIFGL